MAARNPWDVNAKIGLVYRGPAKDLPVFMDRLKEICEDMDIRVVGSRD